MAGFWELMAHYRELTNKKGAFRISEKELGLMRDLDPNNQKDTAVMKLARKRFLEFTSSQKQFPANLEPELSGHRHTRPQTCLVCSLSADTSQTQTFIKF